VTIYFVNIGGIADHNCLIFLLLALFWCKDNNMLINCNKTIMYDSWNKAKTCISIQNEELSLTINTKQLQHSACEKLLGIKIDNLNWKNQIDQICSKISSKIYLLSKIKKYFNLESRQLFLFRLYFTFN